MTDYRYRYVRTCSGCGGDYASCHALWAESRVCCPDCDHGKAHPPPGSWRDFHALELVPSVDARDWYEFDLARELDPLMEAGHA